MDYSRVALSALLEEVDLQGGAMLADPCVGHEVEYTDPQQPLKSPAGDIMHVFTQGCGHPVRFVTTYDPGMTPDEESGAGYATACAVCDSMGAWPRYEEAVRAADPDYWNQLKEEEEGEA